MGPEHQAVHPSIKLLDPLNLLAIRIRILVWAKWKT